MPLFISIVVISPLLVIATRELLIQWGIIELGLISLLPLIKRKDRGFTYFLVQSVGSLTLLYGVIISRTYVIAFKTDVIATRTYVIVLGLLLKLGVFPFHAWVPRVYISCGPIPIFLISTFRKIPPLIILFGLKLEGLTYVGVATALCGAIGGIGQKDLPPLLAFSSINMTGWLVRVTPLPGAPHLVLWAIVLYAINLALVLDHPTAEWWDAGFIIKILSLAGLPPFPGFYPKRRIFADMGFSTPSLRYILAISSIIALRYYFMLIRSHSWEAQEKKYRWFSITVFTLVTWAYLGWGVGGII